MSLYDEKAAQRRHHLAALQRKLANADEDYRQRKGEILEREIAVLKEKLRGQAP